MTERDLDRERAFLTEAARGHKPFVDQATARLDAGEEIYGDSWKFIGLRRHLVELLEEAADLGSWAVLAVQALDTEPGLSDADRQRIAAVLAATASHGARTHAVLSTITRALSAGTRS